MKTTRTLIALALLAPTVHAAPVQRLVLDRAQPVEIPVGEKVATTLQFPSPVRGIFGYGLTKGDAPGTYHYAHPDGSRIMTVRNLAPDKSTFVTVLLGEDELFVLRLTPSAEPPVTVLLTAPEETAKLQLASPITLEEAEARRLEPDADRLFNLLKLGKNARVFRAALPHLYADAESRDTDYRHDDGEVATVVTAVHRFKNEDAVLLAGHIENKGSTPQQFDPGSLQVSVGSRTYPVALVDVADEIPPSGSAPFHVLLRGGPEGERAHLSIKNEFRLAMPAYAPQLGDPAHTAEPGLVVTPPDPALFPAPAPAPKPKASAKKPTKCSK